jgi:predicted membrane-bound spermidine synthase
MTLREEQGMTPREARSAAAALGFFTIVVQAALLREYLVLFRGSELALGAFYGSWFLAIAVAATAARRSAWLRTVVAARVRAALALYPVGAAVGLALLAGARILAGVPPWAPVPPGVLLVGGFLAAFPVGAVTGVLFPALCDAVAPESRKGASTGYAWEAAGAVLGGLAAAGMFLAGIDGPTAVAAAGLVTSAAAMPWSRGASVRARLVPAIVVAGCLAILVPPAGPAIRGALSDLRLRANISGAALLDETSTPYGLVTTARMGSEIVVAVDGVVTLTVPPGPDVPVDAALLAAQPAGRGRAIVLGTDRFALASALCAAFGDVEVVGPDDRALRTLRAAWESGGMALPPNLHTTVEDPRGRVRRAAVTGERFDLAVIAVGEPRTLGDNRLHTVEFDRELAQVLAPGGVVASGFRSGENVLGPEALRYGRSMRASLAEVFPVVAAVPGDQALLLASTRAGQLAIDPVTLTRRVQDLGAAAGGAGPAAVAERARPDRAEWLRRLLEAPRDEDLVNRDDRPIATFLSLLATLRLSGTGGLAWMWGVREAGAWIPIGLLAVLLLVGMRERLRAGNQPGAVAAPLLLACAGGASIAASVVLMAVWRARVGALYGEIGLASSAVMAGVFLGAMAGRLETPRTARPGAAAFCVAAAGVLLGMPWILDATVEASPLVIRGTLLGLLAVAGALAGAAWPIAALLGKADGVSQRLEAADHAGAAVGAALSGVAGLAILGADGTLRVLAGSLAVALILIALDGGLGTGPGRRFLASRTGRLLTFRTFPWPTITMVGAAMFLCALWTWHAARPMHAGPRTRLTDEEVRAFDPADIAEWREAPFGHHRLAGVREPAGEAVLLATGAAGPGVEGYGGPIDLALSVGADGAIRRVEVLAHRETPAYVKDLPAWVQRFRGMDIRDLAAKGQAAVDAMTGATVTSRAVSGTLALAGGRVGDEVLGIAMPAPGEERPWHAPLVDPRVWYALLALVGAVTVHRWGGARIRLGFLLVSAVVGGAVLQVQLSAGWLIGWLRLDPPSFVAAPGVALMGAGFLVLAALWGPLYCAHVCPFGALQEGVSLVGRRLGLGVAMPPRVHAAFRIVKYGVLAAIGLVLFTADAEARLAWDPLAAVFSGSLDGAAALLVAMALAGSLFTVRFWCRGFCPVGALFNLANRMAALLGRVPARRYGACDLGVQGPDDGDCLQCNRCVRGMGLGSAAGKEEAL